MKMKQKIAYEPPLVETISSRELLTAMGPAQANPSGRVGGNSGTLTDVTGMTGGSIESR
jgi:hypothetical protein